MKLEDQNLNRRAFVKRIGTFLGGVAVARYIPAYAAGSGKKSSTVIPGKSGAFRKSAKPIKIGHQDDLTGALASTGYWRKKATDAAAKWLNQSGGIAGRPIEIVTVDTETQVDVGVRRMHQLIQEHDVDFIIGSEHGGIALASNPIAEKYKVLYLSMSRTDGVTQKGINPYVFRLMVDTDLTAKASAERMVKTVGKDWDVFYADYVWGRSNLNAWKQWVEASGGSVVDKLAMPVNTADPLAYVGKLDHSSDGVFVALLGPDILRSTSALREMGFPAKKLVATDAIFGVADILSLGSTINGMWGMDSLPWELKDKDTADMRRMRDAVGINRNGREIGTNRLCMMGDIWPAWENLGFLKTNIEESGWKSRQDNETLIKHIESRPHYKEGPLFPQGPLFVRPADHQGFCNYYILEIKGGEIRAKKKLPISAGIYPVVKSAKAA